MLRCPNKPVSQFILLSSVAFVASCSSCEPELPPVPRIERLTYEGTVPDGFVMSGIADLHATRISSQCLGLVGYLWQKTGGADNHEYPRKTLRVEGESLADHRYRVTFNFDSNLIGGPCRWQLTGTALSARVIDETAPTQVYLSPQRDLDWQTQLWKGSDEKPRRIVIRCFPVTYGDVSGVCEDHSAGDPGIPNFEGSLTIPLDIVVPGGFKATHARRLTELVLDQE